MRKAAPSFRPSTSISGTALTPSRGARRTCERTANRHVSCAHSTRLGAGNLRRERPRMLPLRPGCAPSKLRRLPHSKGRCGDFKRLEKHPASRLRLPSLPLPSTERAPRKRFAHALRRRTPAFAGPTPRTTRPRVATSRLDPHPPSATRHQGGHRDLRVRARPSPGPLRGAPKRHPQSAMRFATATHEHTSSDRESEHARTSARSVQRRCTAR